MRKSLITAILALCMFSFVNAEKISLGIHVNYNIGTSDFFKESVLYLQHSGRTFIETTQNKMGIGFHFDVNIPLVKRLTLSPGFTWMFGHQHFVYQEEEKEDGQLADYFFNLYSGEVNLSYDLLKLKKGWHIAVIAGMNYNFFKADSEMREADKKFLGFQTGLSFKFFQLKRLGFQGTVFYRVPLASGYFSFLGIQAGVLYRL